MLREMRACPGRDPVSFYTRTSLFMPATGRMHTGSLHCLVNTEESSFKASDGGKINGTKKN